MTYPRSSTLTAPTKCAPERCSRCGGSGIFGNYGVCFRCHGNGVDPTYRTWAFPTEWTDAQVAEWNEAREAKNDKARIAAQARREAQANAKFTANCDRFPVLVQVEAMRLAGTLDNTFLSDVLGKSHHFDISEAQANAMVAAVARDTERAAQRAAAAERGVSVPEGRQVITGQVISQRTQEGQYGTTYKMLLLVTTDAGEYKVWGTEPRNIMPNLLDTVTLTATLARSADDPAFGFFSRPTKATVAA